MQLRGPVLAWTLAGMFAATAATGWATPALIQTSDQTSSAAAATPATSTQNETVAAGTAPNYREIVARNKAAVVGISAVTQGKGTSEHESPFNRRFQWNPFGGPDENPFSPFFRGFPGPSPQGP